MEEQFNKEAKQGWSFAADVARTTDENARCEDRNHTSGEVFVAQKKESIPSNEGRIAKAWVNVRGSMRVFSVHFWHSEGWTPCERIVLGRSA